MTATAAGRGGFQRRAPLNAGPGCVRPESDRGGHWVCHTQWRGRGTQCVRLAAFAACFAAAAAAFEGAGASLISLTSLTWIPMAAASTGSTGSKGLLRFHSVHWPRSCRKDELRTTFHLLTLSNTVALPSREAGAARPLFFNCINCSQSRESL
jgi:hypothetical protein